MADRPNFAAIVKHLQVLKPFGSGLTVEYLEQVTRYALELEQELDELRVPHRGEGTGPSLLVERSRRAWG
jgi:hypothetical protein